MRLLFSLLLLAVTFLFVPAANAGTLTFKNGEGKWTPTGCVAPTAPVKPAHDPEAAANDLNARLMEHQAYTAQIESYMNCISDEAQRDGVAANNVIVNSANKVIQNAQDVVAVRADALEKRTRQAYG